MDKDAIDVEVGLGPNDIVLDMDPAPLHKGGGGGALPQFLAHVYCGPTAGWTKMVVSIDVGLSPVDVMLDGDPALLSKRERSPLPNFRPIYVVAKRLNASSCHLVQR